MALVVSAAMASYSQHILIAHASQQKHARSVCVVLCCVCACMCVRVCACMSLSHLTMSSANLSSALAGSPPGERTKISGAQELESSKVLGKLKGGGSINLRPSSAETNS